MLIRRLGFALCATFAAFLADAPADAQSRTVARQVKRLDPNHPTMTVIAEIGGGGSKLRSIERFCPNIYIVGINSYGGFTSVGERYRNAGGKKPSIVAEVVDFVLGSKDGGQNYSDSTHAELKSVRLTNQWQKVRLPLDGRDLSRIKTGCGRSLFGQGHPVTFFLDDLRYVTHRFGRSGDSAPGR